MQKCPSCQAENEDKVPTCFLCGQKLKKRGLLGRILGGSGSRSEGADSTTYYGETDYYAGDVEVGQPVPPPVPSEEPLAGPTEPPPSKPENAKVLKDQAKDYINQGQFQRAIDANTEAIRINPRYTDAYYNRGLAYILLGQHHSAIEDFDEAIALNAADPDAYYNRAHALFMLHQLDRAIADYSQAIYLDPDNGERYIGRGAAYFEQGAYQNSIDDFAQAIQLGDYPHAYANRAVSYIRLGKIAEAEADINQAQGLGYDAQDAVEELKRQR